jgi:hypothetical protein
MAVGLSCICLCAHAVEGPKPVAFEAGPLGTLDFSAAGDGYFFFQSGTSSDSKTSIAGKQPTGVDVNAWLIELRKSTGLVQFTIQLGEWQNINLGTNRPAQVNDQRFANGPFRTALVTLAPTRDLRVSIGQFPSLEGWESVFPWNNPSALRTVVNAGENSSSRGVEADYAHGPLSASVAFGDGYDTGVWNYVQFLATGKLNADNGISLFGGVPLGVTGPNTFAYGEGGMSAGGPNGNGGQGTLAAVNSNMVGAWYTWNDGDLSIRPEVQFQWTRPINKYADRTSGGLSDDIPKETGNFATAVFASYKFGESPYSLGGWAEYATSHGTGAQASWFIAPDAELVGFAIAPAWQYKQFFTRLNIGYVRLLNRGTPSAGFGDTGNGRNQVVTTLEFALVY